jgi:hypothetical protein
VNMHRSLYMLSICFFLLAADCPVIAAEEATITPQPTVTPTIPVVAHVENKVIPQTTVTTPTPMSVFTPVHHADNDNQSGKFIFQIQGSEDYSFVSTNDQYEIPGYYEGLGSELMIGYSVNKNIILGLLSGYHDYVYNAFYYVNVSPPISASGKDELRFVPLEAMAQFYLFNFHIGGNEFRPYFLLGVGVCFDTYTSSGTSTSNYPAPQTTVTYGYNFSTTDFLLEPGIGLSYEVSNNFNLFIQTKVTLDFAGVQLSLDNNPVNVFVPIQLGVNYSL